MVDVDLIFCIFKVFEIVLEIMFEFLEILFDCNYYRWGKCSYNIE